jgi:hypothetical protein
LNEKQSNVNFLHLKVKIAAQLVREMSLRLQLLHGVSISSALRFAKIRSIRVLGKLGKGFFIKNDGRVEEWKGSGWRRIVSLCFEDEVLENVFG